MKPVLLVFARHWEGGPVKTRLAAGLGPTRARAIYRELAELCWSHYAPPGGGDDRGEGLEAWERWLLVEPAAAAPTAAVWLEGATRVLGQSSGDLGVRLHAAFRAAFTAGAPWAAAVGTDAPELDAPRISAAGAALATHDAALIPALDGGYVLLAMSSPHPELFHDIPWGSPEVAALTRRRAQEAGLRLWLGSALRDIDTAADFHAWQSTIPKGPAT